MTHNDDTPADVAQRWPRERWIEVADGLLAAAAPHASPRRSLIRLPGPVSASGAWSDGLEGFARTFLLAAFRVAGERGADAAGLLHRYADGLRAGVDAECAERWPRIGERRQAVPEAASVAIALSETRPWLWDRLDDLTRERAVEWLAQVVGTSGYRSNWLWFQNVIETFLRSVGGPWDQADLDRNAEVQEQLYVGDGWYSDGFNADGRRQSFDYYAGWAWHVYPTLCARIDGTELDPLHRARLRAYLDQAQQFVGHGGGPLFQGRSLTYRFAVLAPFWTGALARATPLSPGQTQAVSTSVLDYFLRHGAIDDRGLLPIGWHGHYGRLRQLYSGGSSPFWASKAFLGLLLPADDDVWTSAPQPLESWRRDQIRALDAPGWIVSSTADDGIVRVANHGTDHAKAAPFEPRTDDPFYLRVGYSNVTAPQLTAEALTDPVESCSTLLDAASRPAHRGAVHRLGAAGRIGVSRARVRWLDVAGRSITAGDSDAWASFRYGPIVTVASVLRGAHEVRIAFWTSAPPPSGRAPRPGQDLDSDVAWPQDDGPWWAHIGGWPIAAAGPADLAVERCGDSVSVVRRSDGLRSVVRGIAGVAESGTTQRTGADPFGTYSVTPWVRSMMTTNSREIWAAQLTLTVGEMDGLSATVHERDADILVEWSDGEVDRLPGLVSSTPHA